MPQKIDRQGRRQAEIVHLSIITDSVVLWKIQKFDWLIRYSQLKITSIVHFYIFVHYNIFCMVVVYDLNNAISNYTKLNMFKSGSALFEGFSHIRATACAWRYFDIDHKQSLP